MDETQSLIILINYVPNYSFIFSVIVEHKVSKVFVLFFNILRADTFHRIWFYMWNYTETDLACDETAPATAFVLRSG